MLPFYKGRRNERKSGRKGKKKHIHSGRKKQSSLFFFLNTFSLSLSLSLSQMTELSPVSHMALDGSRVAAVGRLVPNMEALLVDTATGIPVPHGKEGELLLRGMRKNRKEEKETKKEKKSRENGMAKNERKEKRRVAKIEEGRNYAKGEAKER